MRLGGAGLIAVFVLFGKFKQWPKDRLYGGMFALVSGWIVLLGPATEVHTYLMIAPAVVIAFVDALINRQDKISQTLATLAYALILFGILRVRVRSEGWRMVDGVPAGGGDRIPRVCAAALSARLRMAAC